MRTQIKPGRRFYLIPVGIFIFGIIVAVIFSVRLLTDNGNITTHNPRNNLVFNVTEGDTLVFAIEGITFMSYNLIGYDDHLDIVIDGKKMTYTFEPDQVEIEFLSNNTSLTIDNYEIMLEFKFKETGIITLTPEFEDNDFPNISFGTLDTNLASIQLQFTGIFTSVVIGSILALIVGIIIKIKRNRAKDEIFRAAQKIINREKNEVSENY